MFIQILYFNLIYTLSLADNLPTLYEYFTADGIKSGLNDQQSHFTLNEKNITIYGGSMHYFRIPKSYWRDRLRKLKAAGLNAVDTYVPWNLHEYQNGVYDFGNGGSDFEEFLDIVEFIKLAKDEDLFVILRPGPYICAEWEFGGFPSWLLRHENIKLRSNNPTYLHFVERYFKKFLKLIAPLQFSKGGAIIAVQIENEYGSTHPNNTAHLETLKNILKQNGIVELLFISDGVITSKLLGALPGVLMTANFQQQASLQLSTLKKYQPSKPVMVMEYWSGWFDHWAEPHQSLSVEEFVNGLRDILSYKASVNFYMFHGGTNWGFLNGANVKKRSATQIFNEGYKPDVTSYDYDAPLSEAGDYTPKYFAIKELINKHNKLRVQSKPLPVLTKRFAYDPITIIAELPFDKLLEQSPVVPEEKLVSMELLPINNNSGQSYGYIVYRFQNIDIPKRSILKIEGRVCDTVLVLINGKLKNKILSSDNDIDEFGFWRITNSTLNLGNAELKNARLELVVENMGRINFGHLNQFNQYKGLWQGNVLINSRVQTVNEIIPMEFTRSWIRTLRGWNQPTPTKGPKLLKAVLEVTDPLDTYISTENWTKGIIIVNDFVLARYMMLGPQMSVYLPAPFLKNGTNEILFFEEFLHHHEVRFVEDLILKDV